MGTGFSRSSPPLEPSPAVAKTVVVSGGAAGCCEPGMTSGGGGALKAGLGAEVQGGHLCLHHLALPGSARPHPGPGHGHVCPVLHSHLPIAPPIIPLLSCLLPSSDSAQPAERNSPPPTAFLGRELCQVLCFSRMAQPHLGSPRPSRTISRESGLGWPWAPRSHTAHFCTGSFGRGWGTTNCPSGLLWGPRDSPCLEGLDRTPLDPRFLRRDARAGL